MDIETSLINDLGLTSDYHEALWLLKSGQLVSNKKAIHMHEGIAKYFDKKLRSDPGTCVYKFMQQGHIKLFCGSSKYYIEFATVPTQEQFNALYNMLKHAVKNKIPVELVKHRPRYNAKLYTPRGFFQYLSRYTKLQSPHGGIIVYDIEPQREGFYFAVG